MTEDGTTLTANGALTVSDVDSGEAVFHALTPAALVAAHGNFTFDTSSGAWTYTLDHDKTDSLADGQVVHDVLTVMSVDGTATHDIDVAITGTNDAATIAATSEGSDAGAVTEDVTLTANGALTVSDVDSGEAVFEALTPAALVAAHGNFTFDTSSGAWTYTLDHDKTDSLADGQVVHDVLTVMSVDGTATHDIDVAITGTNDAPVISTDNLSIAPGDNGDMVISGLSVTDPDASPNELFTLTVAADSGNVVPSADTSDLSTIQDDLDTGFTFTPGESATDKVAVTVTDSHGASDTVNFIFNVENEPSEPVTLAGTTGKDVFFSTGYEDKFVFTANSNHDTVIDFAPDTDHIDLSAVVTTSDPATWFNQHVQASPTNSSDTLVTIDAADTILLKNTALASLSASDFILHVT